MAINAEKARMEAVLVSQREALDEERNRRIEEAVEPIRRQANRELEQ